VKEVITERGLDQSAARLLLPFHALTGCDTTSFLSGHSKKTAMSVFLTHKQLLQGLGNQPLNEQTMRNAETFVCQIYKVPEAATADKARVTLFKKALRPELLPPTTDALRHHIRRAHYQSIIWLRATALLPNLPPATSMGWEFKEGQLKPVLISIPAVPASCMELITCGCTTRCSSTRCKCRTYKMPCTGACKCLSNCMNIGDQ
jgi:hypothetical protein